LDEKLSLTGLLACAKFHVLTRYHPLINCILGREPEHTKVSDVPL
jgi:hypothetical protein